MTRYIVEWSTNPQYDDRGDIDLDRLTENVKTFKQLAKAIAFARMVKTSDFFGSPAIYRQEARTIEGLKCWESVGYPIGWDT